MLVLLDIKDSKSDQLLGVLKDLKYVKIKQLKNGSAKFLMELKEAVDELNLVLDGKLEARPIEELLNEL